MFRRFLADQSGASSIEYALIAVLISTAALVAIDAAGVTLNAVFMNISAGFNGP
jgi:pilus assembly protein Flp/PilA